VRDLSGAITLFELSGSTTPKGITQDGRITGFSVFGNGYVSFIRDPLGQTTTFQVPGATQGTIAFGINDQGQIAGQVITSRTSFFGFLRQNDGSVIEFSAPGAGTGSNQGTIPRAINRDGVVAGYLLNGQSSYLSFIRNSEGQFTVFNAPGAGTGPNQGTVLRGLNNLGSSTGEYVDAQGNQHGFVRF
jgi:hypothetical protein